MKVISKVVLLLTASFVRTAAWAPVSSSLPVGPSRLTSSPGRNNIHLPLSHHKNADNEIEQTLQQISTQQFDFPESNQGDVYDIFKTAAPLATASMLAMMPLPAAAAGDQIPSAIAAYAHYLTLVAVVGLVVFERTTVEAGMSKEKETSLAIADAGLGLTGVGILVSGYYRATQYGKGWDFYSHEPIFWLKMIFVCIFGAASLFPTTTFIKRSVAIQTGKELEPMSEKLASRLQSVLTAELVMIGSIPLAATLMARGVWYTEAIPFNIIGPALCAVTAGGLGFKYVKEALTWSED